MTGVLITFAGLGGAGRRMTELVVIGAVGFVGGLLATLVMTCREGRVGVEEENVGVLLERGLVSTLVGDGSDSDEMEGRRSSMPSTAACSTCSAACRRAAVLPRASRSRLAILSNNHRLNEST